MQWLRETPCNPNIATSLLYRQLTRGCVHCVVHHVTGCAKHLPCCATQYPLRCVVSVVAWCATQHGFDSVRTQVICNRLNWRAAQLDLMGCVAHHETRCATVALDFHQTTGCCCNPKRWYCARVNRVAMPLTGCCVVLRDGVASEWMNSFRSERTTGHIRRRERKIVHNFWSMGQGSVASYIVFLASHIWEARVEARLKPC